MAKIIFYIIIRHRCHTRSPQRDVTQARARAQMKATVAYANSQVSDQKWNQIVVFLLFFSFLKCCHSCKQEFLRCIDMFSGLLIPNFELTTRSDHFDGARTRFSAISKILNIFSSINFDRYGRCFSASFSCKFMRIGHR